MEIFTDGGAWNNGKTNCKAGCGIYIPEINIRISEEFTNNPTNQRAELYAIQKALEITDGHVKIYSDSMYSIKCITLWSNNWVKNEWKNSKGENVKNQDILKKILYLVKNRTVEFSHVKSHQKKPDNYEEIRIWKGNLVADQLASQAINLKIINFNI
jgi:ribonuclease HI